MTINIPFDMRRTGAVISRLRKEHHMTQMQLADALNISFQAVSNWERGLSMPDISKLPELAELFGTTIDELLGRRCPVLEEAAAGRLLIHLDNTEVSLAEAVEAAPLLPPEQAEALAAHVADRCLPEDESLELSDLLPFMSGAQIDRLFEKRLATGNYAELLPFVSGAVIDAAAQSLLEAGQDASDFIPFVSGAVIDGIALQRSDRDEDFSEYLPFLSSSALLQIFRQRIRRKQSVSMLLPFLPASAIDQLASSFTDD